MADERDILEQLRLKRLELLQEEQARKSQELSSGKFDYTPANVYPGRVSLLKHIIPPEKEGYSLDGDDRSIWGDPEKPDAWMEQELKNDLAENYLEKKELQNMPNRFQKLFTPIKGK